MNSAWVKHAISEINADYQRSADTHLIRLALPAFPGIQLYLKDESTHPTGSLSIAWPARCFCMACATAGLKKERRLSNPLPVRPPSLKLTSLVS